MSVRGEERSRQRYEVRDDEAAAIIAHAHSASRANGIILNETFDDMYPIVI